MKIFFSWSLSRSRYVAAALEWWLPNVLQPVEPFISTQNIPKGTRGLSIIADNLEKSNVGIVCLTEENLGQPWILFEAGALSKLATVSYVCTFVLDLEPSEIAPPLGQFQHTRYIMDDPARSKSEVKDLVTTLNGVLGERALKPHRLEEAFETWWPKLEDRLKSIPERKADEQPPQKRTLEDKVDEILEAMRESQQQQEGMFETLIATSDSLGDVMPYVADIAKERGWTDADSVPAHVRNRLIANGLIEMKPGPDGTVALLTSFGMAKLNEWIRKGHSR